MTQLTDQITREYELEQSSGVAQINRGQLKSTRREHDLDGVLEVVMIRDKILGEPVEQVGIPSRLLHIIYRLDETAPEKASP